MSLRIAHHNARNSPSIRSNIKHLILANYDVICLNEVPSGDYLTGINSHITSIHSSSNARVATLILKKNLIWSEVKVTPYTIIVKLMDSGLTIHNTYLPPLYCASFSPSNLSSLCDVLNNKHSNYLIVGDLNAKTSLLGDRDDARGLALTERINFNNWHLLNDPKFKTYCDAVRKVYSSLDWAIVSGDIASRCSWKPELKTCLSDHWPFGVTINYEANLSSSQAVKSKYVDLKLFLNQVSHLTTEMSTEELLQGIINAAFSSERDAGNRKFNLSPAARDLKLHIKKILHKMRHCSQNELLSLRLSLSDLSRKLHKQSKLDSALAFKKLLGKELKLIYRTWWRPLKQLERNDVNELHIGNEIITNPIEIARRSLDHFFATDDTVPDLKPLLKSCTCDNPLTDLEISAAVNSLKMKAPGIDKINAKILKAWYRRDPTILNYLIKTWFLHQIYPNDLKKTLLIIFYKKRNCQKLLDNIRPIGIATSIAKIYDTVLNNRIKYYLSKSTLMHPAQFAYIKGSSAISALTKLDELRRTNLGGHEFVISLDIRGAFNNLLHHAIINHMHTLDIPPNLTNLVINNFVDRLMCIQTVNQTVSTPLKRGIVQGSILSPTLFRIGINKCLNDIQSAIDNSSVHANLIVYADDITVVLKAISSLDEAKRKIEWLIHCISFFLRSAGLTLSLSKTQLLSNRGKSKVDINIGDAIIRCSSQICVLGFTVSTTAGHYNAHVLKAIKSANDLLPKLKTVIGSKHCPHRKKTALILSLIHSKILYAHTIWLGSISNKTLLKLLALDRQINIISFKAPFTLSHSASLLISQQHSVVFRAYRGSFLSQITSQGIEPSTNTPLLTKLLSKIPSHPSSHLPINIRHYITSTADDIRGRYDYYYHTDCSRNTSAGSGTGIAFILSNRWFRTILTKRYCLPHYVDVYYGEILCIYRAILNISKSNLSGRICIVSDSLSSLQALCNPCNKSTLTILIREALSILDCQVTFAWCKAHAGIPLNELVDSLAKEARSLPPEESLPCPPSLISSLAFKHAVESTRKVYNALPSNATIKFFFPDLIIPLPSYVKFNTHTIQVYTGHGIFYDMDTHSYHTCDCGQLCSPSHYLLECFHFIDPNLQHMVDSGLFELISTDITWPAIASMAETHKYISVAAPSLVRIMSDMLDNRTIILS